ncbi:MAG: RagB/SusD family nutrient uptake outer membrane protein [Marinilabiliaceae bacterium]|nr:RagB/SusD family nutrient uptake outer membrane protein [Marinilabiliaceae bacterium]
MKFKYIIVFACLLSLWSCDDEFMERYPLDAVNDENFWRNESDLELYCNNFYEYYITGHQNGWGSSTNWPWGYAGSKFMYGDIHSDNAMSKYWSRAKMINGKYVEPTGSESGGWYFRRIRNFNFFLDNYTRVNIEPEVRNQYAGEIFFFKAFDYFEKVKLFGDVPWLDRVLDTDSPELYGPRTPRVQVMDSVLMCINKAIDCLPSKGAAKPERLNKDVALLVKARICLHEGTFRKYHSDLNLDETKFLNEAVNACQELMGAGYKLYSTGNPDQDYYNLFVQYNYDNNPEVLLYRKYGEDVLGHASLRYYNLNLRNQVGATKSLVNEYLCADGQPISSSLLYLGDDSIQSEMRNRDPRLRQTVAAPGEYILNPNNTSATTSKGKGPEKKMPDIPGTTGFVCPTGYRLVKYWIDDMDEIGRVTNGILPCPEFRYAEILLIYAEAMAELGKSDQGVLDATVNKLRDRVGMTHMTIGSLPEDAIMDGEYSKYCGYVPSALIREIRRERRVELANENFRWDDLCRWRAGGLLLKSEATRGMKYDAAVQVYYGDKAPEIGKSIHVDENNYIMPYARSLETSGGRVFEEPKQYYFPIPLEELVMNKNLVQNPGWKDASSLDETE